MKRLLVIFLLFFCSVAGFAIGRQTTPPPPSTSPTEVHNQGNFHFINPLLECDSNYPASDHLLTGLHLSLETLVKQLTDSHKLSFASIYFRDLNNGPWFGINENELFSPASLAKVPLMIAYYKLSEANPSTLTQELEYTPINTEDQNIPPAVPLTLNQKYTVEELIRRMIVYSDNSAYNLLNSNLPVSQLIQVYNDLGVDIRLAQVDPSGNIIPVKSYASFFRILYNSSYLSKTNSEHALQMLSLVDYKKALVAGIPEGITVAHKFGERHYLATNERQLHDCGIVYLPQHPYLACIMTRGDNFDNLTSAIRQISATIYDTVK